jgi:hypothetical protein
MMVGAWASAAGDYTRTAELFLDAPNIDDFKQKRQESSIYHKKAAHVWKDLDEKAKAAKSQVQAAIALNYGEEGSNMLSKDALAGMERGCGSPCTRCI